MSRSLKIARLVVSMLFAGFMIFMCHAENDTYCAMHWDYHREYPSDPQFRPNLFCPTPPREGDAP